MPSNTGYKPVKVSDFEAVKLNFWGDGIYGSAAANGSTTFDYAITDDVLITGGNICVTGGGFGDYMTLQVLDASGALTGVKNYVLNTFVNKWFVGPGTFQLAINIPYPAKILTGMAIRLTYTSVQAAAAQVIANYSLHKVLV